MTDERSPPPPTAVKSYAGGIAARTAERQDERRRNPVFPNLGQAAVTYKPEHGVQTLEDIGRTQRADADNPDGPQRAQLSGETVEGLRALRAAQEAAQTAAPPPPPSVPPPQGTPDPEPDDEDLAFAEALRGAQKDVIQNERERAAVAARVAEIDLAEGLLTGEFTQLVPIVPGKLEVKFRCLTTGENNALRLYLFSEIEADPRKARIAQELLGFYQTVATVMTLNKTNFAKHMVADGHRLAFQTQIFEEKVHAFMAYPLPLVASLGTHASWFEQRVRDLFATADRLKNG